MSAHKPLLPVGEALALMAAAARPVTDVETVPTLTANGRVLAKAQVSGMNVPGMDNTQMDGYAVRAADCVSGNAALTVSQRIPAGHVGQPLLPGTAARIFTGALIPEGADAVVMQEQCELAGNVVTVRHAPKSGEWIRRAGEDITNGSTSCRPVPACAARNWVWRLRSAWPSCRSGVGCTWRCSSPATS